MIAVTDGFMRNARRSLLPRVVHFFVNIVRTSHRLLAIVAEPANQLNAVVFVKLSWTQ